MKVKEWSDKVPEEILEDITFAIEKTDNLKTGESLSQVMKNIENTPGGKEVFKHIQERFEKTRKEINEFLGEITEGEYISHIENYVTHIYKGDAKGFVARWKETSPNARQRKYPTYEEAIKPVSEGGGGLEAKTYNAGDLYQHYVDTNWKIASNRVIADQMRGLVTEDGHAFSLSGQQYNKLPEYLKKDYAEIDSYFLRNSFKKEGVVYDGKTYIHRGEGLHNAIEAIYNKYSTTSKAVNAYEQVSAVMKHAQLLWSLFHHYNLTESSIIINGRPFNPIRGIANIGEFDPTLGRRGFGFTHKQGQRLMKIEEFAKDAVEHGLQLGAHSDIAVTQFQKGMQNVLDATKLDKVPGYEHLSKVSKLKNWWDKQLWENYHNPLKAATYYNKVARILEKNPELNPKQVKETVAQHVNDAFGGLEWEAIDMPKSVRQSLQRGLLAADYTLANIRVKGRTGLKTGDKLQQKLHREYLVKSYMTRFGISTAVSAVIYEVFGDPSKGDKKYPWEYEMDKGLMHGSIDVTPMYRSIGKAFGDETMLLDEDNPNQRFYISVDKQGKEVERMFLDPKAYVGGKANPIIGGAFEQFTGASVSGFPQYLASDKKTEVVEKRLKHIFGKFVPFSFGDNNFMFALPKGKGMTPYKAQEHYSAGLKAYADESLDFNRNMHKIKKGDIPNMVRKGNLKDMYTEVTDALELNNPGSSDATFNNARGSVLNDYYGKVWREMKDERKITDDLRNSLKTLARLGASEKSVMSSYKGHLKKKPYFKGKLKISEIMKEFTKLRQDLERIQ